MPWSISLIKVIVFWTHIATPLGIDGGCGCNNYEAEDGLPICRCNIGTCYCQWGLEACPSKGKNCGCAWRLCYCQSKEEDCRCENGKCKCAGCEKHRKVVEINAYRWVRGDSFEQIHLFDGKVQVGTYRYDEDCYYPFNGEAWGFACLVPKDCPKIPTQIRLQTKSRN